MNTTSNETANTEVSKTNNYDPRYAFVTCSKCGQKWQRIDYGGSRHGITCSKRYEPFPPQIEPSPIRALTPAEWYAFDCDNGIDMSISISTVK